MTGPKLINIGTPENPIMVPEEAVKTPQEGKGREWWGMVADGSVVVEPEVLDKLLEETKKNGI